MSIRRALQHGSQALRQGSRQFLQQQERRSLHQGRQVGFMEAGTKRMEMMGFGRSTLMTETQVLKKVRFATNMEISVATMSLGVADWSCGDAVAAGTYGVCFDKDGNIVDDNLANLDQTVFGGALQAECKSQEFVGKPGTKCHFIFRDGASQTMKTVFLYGLGDPVSVSHQFALFGVTLASELKWSRLNKISIGAFGGRFMKEPFSCSLISRLMPKFCEKKNHKDGEIKTEIQFIESSQDGESVFDMDKVSAIAMGMNTTMKLVDTPANIVNPTYLAQVASTIQHENKDLMDLTVLEAEDCEKRGMGLYLGVGKGSAQPPKFIHLTYNPPAAENVERAVAIIGKGVTFDSGGLNLKVGEGSMIDLMKFDMGGSACVLGAAVALAKIRPRNVRVHFIIAACENMVNGSATKPGDILTASDGTTVEINNTDAEGRLTMADALVYAQKLDGGVDEIVDVATLTGACIIALGEDIAGLFANDDRIANSLQSASSIAGEKIWRMPMDQALMKGLESPIADLKNTGPRPGGSITAALFLNHFIAKGTPFAHLDIAGPVFDVSKKRATGFGTNTLVQFILQPKQ